MDSLIITIKDYSPLKSTQLFNISQKSKAVLWIENRNGSVGLLFFLINYYIKWKQKTTFIYIP